MYLGGLEHMRTGTSKVIQVGLVNVYLIDTSI